jgi:hypothetical protein
MADIEHTVFIIELFRSYADFALNLYSPRSIPMSVPGAQSPQP